MNFYVKETPRKIKHPSDDPYRAKKEAIGAANFSKMKFENEAEKSDYMKRVNANPMNTMGRPAWYPPVEIRSSLSETREARKCECGGCATWIDGFICPRCGKQN